MKTSIPNCKTTPPPGLPDGVPGRDLDPIRAMVPRERLVARHVARDEARCLRIDVGEWLLQALVSSNVLPHPTLAPTSHLFIF